VASQISLYRTSPTCSPLMKVTVPIPLGVRGIVTAVADRCDPGVSSESSRFKRNFPKVCGSRAGRGISGVPAGFHGNAATFKLPIRWRRPASCAHQRKTWGPWPEQLPDVVAERARFELANRVTPGGSVVDFGKAPGRCMSTSSSSSSERRTLRWPADVLANIGIRSRGNRRLERVCFLDKPVAG
jgi:hypothetical protein